MTLSSSATTVRTRTRARGAAALIRWVASIPDIAGMFEIHEHDIWQELLGELDARRGERGLSDDVDAVLLEQLDQAASKQLVVIDHNRADPVLTHAHPPCAWASDRPGENDHGPER